MTRRFMIRQQVATWPDSDQAALSEFLRGYAKGFMEAAEAAEAGYSVEIRLNRPFRRSTG